MNFQTPVSTSKKVDEANQLARQLGDLLLNAPEYQIFLKTLNDVNNDPTVKKILAEMRNHQNDLRWSPENADEHEVAISRLETELENLAVVQDYRIAEKTICKMFAEIDEIISRSAGIPFAANARRSGCSCGG
ncbi:MAG: YlbF family regulator [Chloroflexi bacterium]|nr:YlbF family regulator [Chloroflexota bacterium]